MCINNNDSELKKIRLKNNELKLWKVVRKDNKIGLWSGTGWNRSDPEEYLLGLNIAKDWQNSWHCSQRRGQFHCFFTCKDARKYTNFRYGVCSDFNDVKSKRTKIIRVYAKSSDAVMVGDDYDTDIQAISVSKMTIKSLKHQR